MLYRFTLTFDLDITKYGQKEIDKLRDAIKAETELITGQANVKVEDEDCIQNNKKMIIHPIVDTIDVHYDKDKPYSSSMKILRQYLQQLEEDGKQSTDYHMALVTAINGLIAKIGEEE